MGSVIDALKSMDKKTIILLVGGIGGIILLILILNLLSKATTKTYDSYEDVENRLVEAAKNYYQDNSAYLPIVDRTTNSVTLNTLVAGQYIKTLDNYIKNAESCDAVVTVLKTPTAYEYTPYLNCGTDYITIELYKKVLEDNTITTTGVGLYSMDGEKVFRGEVKNNFIMLDDKLWRIVKVDENNNLVLMSHFKTESYTWDDRYNQEVETNNGINDYNVSRIKETIEKDYYDGTILSDASKNKIVYTKACLGSRKLEESGSIKEIECSERTTDEVPIRMLMIGEYIQASIDPNCTTPSSKSCINYNYMNDMKASFWTITKGQRNSSYVYNIASSGVYETVANAYKQVRYVILLGTRAFYLSGSGTIEDPYKIK